MATRLEERKAGAMIDLLVEHELLAAEFYLALAENCETHRAFWRQMAEAERGHALLCEKLGEDLLKGRAALAPNVFDRETLERAGNVLARLIAAVHKDRPSCEQAFARALGMERGIIEQQCFEVVNDENEATAEFKHAMRDSLKAHLHRIQQEFDQLADNESKRAAPTTQARLLLSGK